ncbi:MAG: hypothetical protein JWM80_91 [Cyanobacteria bacterium RYN_339]|nr:hypothetical protein [Cyanobacteria bacterium RYN_339]
MTTQVSGDPTKPIKPAQGTGSAEQVVPKADGQVAPAVDPKAKPQGNAVALSGSSGGSQLALPGTTSTTTHKVTKTTTTTVTEEDTTTTTAAADPAAAKPAEEPAASTPAEKVPDYNDTFGGASYVKDGANKDMVGLAQKLVEKNPALKDSDLAKHIQEGKLGPDDVKAIQSELQAKGYDVGHTGADGKYGPNTHAALQKMLAGEKPEPKPAPGTTTDDKPADTTNGTNPATPSDTGKPTDDAALEGKLKDAAEHSKFNEGIHKCFKYAWDVNKQVGGKGIDQATQSHDGRGKPVTSLDQMAKDGKIKPGDVIYVNKSPGADPSSTKLQYGPHWFVYMGHGKFADQYHNRSTGGREKSAAEMQQFVRGRVIDTIYHTH